MFKEKRINYAIGVVFGALILGFLGAPFLGVSTGYGVIEMIEISRILGDDLTLALCAFDILVIIATCLMISLGVVGFVLKCTPLKNSKAEKVVSWIYSAMVIATLVFAIIMICLVLGFDLNTIKPQYGYWVILGIIAIFPYFSVTKMPIVALAFLFLMTGWFGVGVYIVQIETSKFIEKKNAIKHEKEKTDLEEK